MILVNIHEAKAKLSEYLDAAARGERVMICKRNRPIAELKSVATTPVGPRPVGTAKGRLIVPETFFEPLPDQVLDLFHAGADGAPGGRAPETPGKYGAPAGKRARGRR